MQLWWSLSIRYVAYCLTSESRFIWMQTQRAMCWELPMHEIAAHTEKDHEEHQYTTLLNYHSGSVCLCQIRYEVHIHMYTHFICNHRYDVVGQHWCLPPKTMYAILHPAFAAWTKKNKRCTCSSDPKKPELFGCRTHQQLWLVHHNRIALAAHKTVQLVRFRMLH